MTFIEALIFGLATYRITRFLTRDVLFNGTRDKIWNKYPPESSKIGYLFTCEWCMSIWVALVLQISRMIIPTPTYVVEIVFAMSAIAGLLTAYEDKD
jgi:hypothetical protein